MRLKRLATNRKELEARLDEGDHKASTECLKFTEEVLKSLCDAYAVEHTQGMRGMGSYLKKLREKKAVPNALCTKIEQSIIPKRNQDAHESGVQYSVAMGYGFLEIVDELLAIVGVYN